MMAGAVVVLALLWLIQLTRSLQDQSDKLAQIGRQRRSLVRRAAARRSRPSWHSRRLPTKATAPDDFLTQCPQDHPIARPGQEKLEHEATINGELAAKIQSLAAANTKLNAELDHAKAYEKRRQGSRQAPRQAGRSGDETQTQDTKLADQQELIEANTDRGGARLVRQYNRAWYAAAAGWGFAGLFALGLAAAFGLKPLPDHETQTEVTPSPVVPSDRRSDEPPPHHIT